MNISSEGPVAHNQAQRQSGTHSIPPGLDAFIIRLPNPISGYNDKIRVQNEVAALSIARDALQAKFPDFIPRVFGWGSAKYGRGWILQEHMAGRPLLNDFHQMSDKDKAYLLRQMADVLSIPAVSTAPYNSRLWRPGLQSVRRVRQRSIEHSGRWPVHYLRGPRQSDNPVKAR